MRVFGIALFIALTVASADQVPRALTPYEMKALHSQIALGRNIVSALGQYSKTIYELNGESGNMWNRGMTGLGLLTRTPTVQVLHAAGYITDFDLVLAERYRATPQPVPTTQRLATCLTMQTDRGELLFDTHGNITVR